LVDLRAPWNQNRFSWDRKNDYAAALVLANVRQQVNVLVRADLEVPIGTDSALAEEQGAELHPVPKTPS